MSGKLVTAIVIGAGKRGRVYAGYALDYADQLKIVGVAEPRAFQRERLQNEHNIPLEHVHTSWEDIAVQEKLADCVIITTQDIMHKDPALAFSKKGYHILIEKPMAVTLEDCKEIVDSCKQNGVMLAVCHVLRYTPHARKIRDIIDSGAIGDVVNIQHLEPVGFWHFAHSYVRGNWRRLDSSCPSLLAKSCHDMDLIQYWMPGRRCLSISSFGSLRHFNKANKVGFWHFAHSFVRGNWRDTKTSCPSLLQKSCHDIDLISYWLGHLKCQTVSSFGSLKHFVHSAKPHHAGSRCLDCKMEKDCPYSAKKIYLDPLVQMGHRGWPVDVITDVVDIENVTDALTTGSYGRCVYDCDNDVMDNQVVTMQYEGGATVSFSMVAFTEKLCARQTRIFGTKGQIECDFDQIKMKHFDFNTRQTVFHDMTEEVTKSQGSRLSGHFGADFFAAEAFFQAVSMNDSSRILTGPDESLKSHWLTFLAEKAREENRVINVNEEMTM